MPHHVVRSPSAGGRPASPPPHAFDQPNSPLSHTGTPLQPPPLQAIHATADQRRGRFATMPSAGHLSVCNTASWKRMEAAWACVVDRATDMAESAKRFFSFRSPPDGPNPTDILKHLQRQAFYDIMQLRERQDKVERALLLFKATKSGPFAEESTHVKGLINASGVLALTNDKKRDAAPDGSEANTGISSRFMFQTTVRKKDALSAELVTDHKYIYRENDPVGSPLVLSKVMYLANINDYLSVAAVPVGARCDDFSTDPNLREGHWLASFNSLLRPPMLMKHHNHATGLIMRSKNFAVSIAGLISAVGKPLNTADASSIFTVFSQILCQMPDETKLTMSTAWHGPNPISRTSKAIPGGCIEMELEIDEDSRIGAWIEVQKSNSRLLTWAIALSDTPQDDLGWGVTLRRGTKGKPQRVQLDGFLNFHLGKKATLQPGVMFTVDARSCKPAVVFRSSWFL